MLEKIQHLLNLDKQRFISIGGLMGAGKSTIVAEFEKVGYEVVCPDRIRHQLAQREDGNEGKYESELEDVLQKYSMLAFKISEKKIKEHLSAGKSVIFDATNLNSKARKQILAWGKDNNMPVIAIHVDCPVDLAIERNIKRSQTIVAERNGQPIYGRYVPTHVIELKAKTQVLPTVREGFAEVYILHVDEGILLLENAKEKLEQLYNSNDISILLAEWKEQDLLKIILNSFDKCWNVDQENTHHKYLLHEHMIIAAKILQKEKFSLFIAGLLHDVGKSSVKCKFGKILVDTEQFKTGEKVEVKVGENGFVSCRILDHKGERQELLTIKHVEVDPEAHYYEHQLVGALIARRELSYIGYDEDFLNEVYDYILYHMDLPFKNPITEKAAGKLLERVGENNVLAMLKLRVADKTGSGAGEDYLAQHQKNVEIFNKLLGRGN